MEYSHQPVLHQQRCHIQFKWQLFKQSWTFYLTKWLSAYVPLETALYLSQQKAFLYYIFMWHLTGSPSCKPCIVTSQSQHRKSLTAICWFIWSVTECLKNDIRPGGPWLFNMLFTTESVKLIARPFLGASWHDMLLHLPKEKRITIRALGNTTSAWLVISALYAVINQLWIEERTRSRMNGCPLVSKHFSFKLFSNSGRPSANCEVAYFRFLPR